MCSRKRTRLNRCVFMLVLSCPVKNSCIVFFVVFIAKLVIYIIYIKRWIEEFILLKIWWINIKIIVTIKLLSRLSRRGGAFSRTRRRKKARRKVRISRPRWVCCCWKTISTWRLVTWKKKHVLLCFAVWLIWFDVCSNIIECVFF